jgi:hypothetical protein
MAQIENGMAKKGRHSVKNSLAALTGEEKRQERYEYG